MARDRMLPRGMRKRGDIYYAWFQTNSISVRRRLSSTFEAAKSMLSDLRARADRGESGMVDNDYSYAELKKELIRWARQHLRCWTDYESDLDMLERFQPLNSVQQVTPAFVVAFRQWRLDGGGSKVGQSVTPRTINRQVGTLNNMLNRACIGGHIAENPIAETESLPHEELSKESRSLSLEEVEALSAESPE